MSEWKSVGAALGKPDPEEKRQEREEAARKRAAYWRALYDGTYVQPPPTNALGQEEFALDGGRPCRVCHGARVMRKPDGSSVVCPECKGIRDESELDLMRQQSGLGVSQWHKSFASFEARPGTEKARAWTVNWAEKLEPALLHLCGEPGSGKTHLACAAARALIERGRGVLFVYGGDLSDEWFRHKELGDLEDWTRLLHSPTPLILDDIGTVRAGSDFDLGKLETLLDKRYRLACPTLLTSIASTEDIKQRFSRSIGRRLEDTALCRSVRIEAPQFRGAGADLPF